MNAYRLEKSLNLSSFNNLFGVNKYLQYYRDGVKVYFKPQLSSNTQGNKSLYIYVIMHFYSMNTLHQSRNG